MAVPTLNYPVHTLDGTELLPAGAVLSAETLGELVSRAGGASQKAYPLMRHGSVKRDILEFMNLEPYRAIFSLRDRTVAMLSLAEKVSLPAPILESLNYFKRYDFYTYRHTLLVFVLATFLAQDLLTDPQDIVDGSAAGPTHDLGKICTPQEILKKTDPLTTTERRILEHHALAGYVLLSYYFKDSECLSAKVARDHHERRDGSGYPRGILLRDRMVEIVAASDVYDALISPRPYRRMPYTNRVALDEIAAMGGRGELSWDVVQALVAHNRKERPHYTQCKVSLARRGLPPAGNAYGVVLEEDEATGTPPADETLQDSKPVEGLDSFRRSN